MIRGHTTRRWTPATRSNDAGPAPLVFAFDLMDTITAASMQYGAISAALRTAGHRVIVITGSGPEAEVKALLTSVRFGYDDLVILDPGSDGSGKADYCKTHGVSFLFDDRIAFGPAMAKAGIPTTFMWDAGPSSNKETAKKLKDTADQIKGWPQYAEPTSHTSTPCPTDGAGGSAFKPGAAEEARQTSNGSNSPL
jgi:hypothetical protein